MGAARSPQTLAMGLTKSSASASKINGPLELSSNEVQEDTAQAIEYWKVLRAAVHLIGQNLLGYCVFCLSFLSPIIELELRCRKCGSYDMYYTSMRP